MSPTITREATATFWREVGAKIRRAREARGLNQKQLAAVVGLWPSAMHHLERGSRTVKLPEFIRIAGALEVPAQALLP